MTAWVWGVDPAVSRIAFAFAPLEWDEVEVETIFVDTPETEGARLGFVDRQVRLYAAQAAKRFPPSVVWVEQPSGRFRAPQLVYCTGVIQAALSEVLRVPVWTIPSGAWKKRAVGVGNATKPQVRAWVDQKRYAADSQDEADAVAIAWAGRLMVVSGSWEAAA